jgi:hypothetical protein
MPPNSTGSPSDCSIGAPSSPRTFAQRFSPSGSTASGSATTTKGCCGCRSARAAILQNPAPHDRQIYPLVGAEELDHFGIADRIADTLGIPVRYEPVEIPAFAAALTADGRTDFFVQHISNVARDYQDGVFSGENNLVEVISGHKPMTVADFVNAHRSDFEHDGQLSLREQLKAS